MEDLEKVNIFKIDYSGRNCTEVHIFLISWFTYQREREMHEFYLIFCQEVLEIEKLKKNTVNIKKKKNLTIYI